MDDQRYYYDIDWNENRDEIQRSHAEEVATLQEENARLREALQALVVGVERDDNPSDEGHYRDSEEMQAARAALAPKK